MLFDHASSATAPATHPNKIPFRGILFVVDKPSDSAPSGARGHRLLIRRHIARRYLATLVGMPVNFKADFSTHSENDVVGIIEKTWLMDDDKVRVEGYCFRHLLKNRPRLRDKELGMSFEAKDVHVTDMRALIWDVSAVPFTGAAILLRKKAAYQSSTFELIEEEESARGSDDTRGSGEHDTELPGTAWCPVPRELATASSHEREGS